MRKHYAYALEWSANVNLNTSNQMREVSVIDRSDVVPAASTKDAPAFGCAGASDRQVVGNLLRLEAGELGDLAPLLHFGHDESLHLLGRATGRLRADQFGMR